MAAVNYYIGVARGAGQDWNPGAVTAGVASATTAVDVEVRMQINDGTHATGLTRKDVNLLICTLMAFLNSGALNNAGVDIPPM